MSCCKDLQKSLKSEDFKYINCNKVIEFCNKVNKSKKSK